MSGAGAKAGAGSSSHACPRPTGVGVGGVTEASTPFEAFHPKSLPPPTDQRVQFLTPKIQTSFPAGRRLHREVPAARGLCPALSALPVPGAGIPGGVGLAAGCSPSPRKSKPPARPETPPGGTDGRDGAVGGLSRSYLS